MKTFGFEGLMPTRPLCIDSELVQERTSRQKISFSKNVEIVEEKQFLSIEIHPAQQHQA